MSKSYDSLENVSDFCTYLIVNCYKELLALPTTLSTAGLADSDQQMKGSYLSRQLFHFQTVTKFFFILRQIHSPCIFQSLGSAFQIKLSPIPYPQAGPWSA